MFHMTNDSGLFRTREELEEKEGAYPVGGNRFASPSGDWMPLYEGKMVHIYNHRYASIRVNPKNISGQGVFEKTASATLQDPAFVPHPRYWVPRAGRCRPRRPVSRSASTGSPDP